MKPIVTHAGDERADVDIFLVAERLGQLVDQHLAAEEDQQHQHEVGHAADQRRVDSGDRPARPTSARSWRARRPCRGRRPRPARAAPPRWSAPCPRAAKVRSREDRARCPFRRAWRRGRRPSRRAPARHQISCRRRRSRNTSAAILSQVPLARIASIAWLSLSRRSVSDLRIAMPDALAEPFRVGIGRPDELEVLALVGLEQAPLSGDEYRRAAGRRGRRPRSRLASSWVP